MAYHRSDPVTPARRFLLLQGPASPFFARLGDALARRGHSVRRIHFNAGDWLFGPLVSARHYRGAIARWPEFLSARLGEWHITDLVLYGDCRPLHRIAIAIARERGIAVHVFEKGYERPNWIALEEGGVNGYSPFPRDPERLLAAAGTLAPRRERRDVAPSFARVAVEEAVYHGSAMAIAEAVGWALRFARWIAFERQRDAAALQQLAAGGRRYYLVPLQLDSDAQIRVHSRFGDMSVALGEIARSFARAAPPESILLIKRHPLDRGIADWRKSVSHVALAAGIADRVVCLGNGDLDRIIAGAAGIVTVNSTAGLRALRRGRPVIALGTALYDLPGLTFHGRLDDFWTEGARPDAVLFDAFSRVLAAQCLVEGDFHGKTGMALAVAGSVARLERRAPPAVHRAPVRTRVLAEAPRLR